MTQGAQISQSATTHGDNFLRRNFPKWVFLSGDKTVRGLRVFLVLSAFLTLGAPALRAQNPVIGNHPAVFNGEGILQKPDNRNSWSPLNLARYLIEKREALDPDWKADAKALIDFAALNFTRVRDGVPVCGEQTYDKKPWGGALSTYGAVLAMYAAAMSSVEYKALAWQALNYSLYAINDDGCPSDGAWHAGRGGWQEDAHTDRIHNFMDALSAFPEWAK